MKKLIDVDKLKLSIRDDKEIDGHNFALFKKHIEESETFEGVYLTKAEYEELLEYRHREDKLRLKEGYFK